MNTRLFLRHREVRLSLMSILGQLILITLTSVKLVAGGVSTEQDLVLVLVLIGFAFIFAVTILRLRNLAKITDYPEI